MKKLLMFVFALILLLSSVACAKTAPTTQTPVTTTPVTTNPTIKPVSFQVLKSNELRITSPNVTDTQIVHACKREQYLCF